MVKEVIRYTDYDGNEREEAFRFNINKIEYHDLDQSIKGGVQGMLQTLIDKNDSAGVIDVLRKFIEKSYGVKSPDGKRMIKSQEILDEFIQSEAYVVLLEKLTSSAEYAAEFIANILPIDETAKKDALREAKRAMDEDVPSLTVLSESNV